MAYIFEKLEKKTFAYDEDEKEPDYTVHKSIRNSVYAYPEKGVAFARIPYFQDGSIMSFDCLCVRMKRCVHFWRESDRVFGKKASGK